MEIKYDKNAVLEYITNLRNLQDLMKHDMDECLNKYNVCKQVYSRIFTECEEESRRAYNRVMSAERETQMADMMMEQAMASTLDFDDEDSQFNYDMINRAKEMRKQAEADLLVAQADYLRTQDNISKLNTAIEKYGSVLEAESRIVNDSFTECSIVGSKASEALEQYVEVMDKAYSELYESALPQSITSTYGSFSTGSSGTSSLLTGVAAAGVLSYMIAGQKREFANNVAGLNQAYKAAIKANDKGAAGKILQAFNSFGNANRDIQSESINKEKSSQNIMWSDIEYGAVSDKIQIADRNSSILEWSGEKGNSLRVPKDKSGELSQRLRNFGVEGIPYVGGDVDFSQVAKYEVEFIDAEKLYVDLSRAIKFSDLMTEDVMKSRTEFNGIIRTKWQSIAKQQIVDKIITDEEFAKDFSAKTGVNTNVIKKVSHLDSELRLNGLTLHETTDCKKIQFVPTQIHDAFKHAGGTAEMLERLINGDIHTKLGV